MTTGILGAWGFLLRSLSRASADKREWPAHRSAEARRRNRPRQSSKSIDRH